MTTRAILVAAAFLAAASIPAHSQETGALRVDVKNKLSGAPVAGAQVSLQGTPIGGVTNDQGIYLNPRVPAGTYIVLVSYIGYGEQRLRDVAVRTGETAALNVTLEQAVLSLQEVVVSATSDPTAGIKVPFTVSKVSSEQLQIPTVNSTLAAIQGKVAGVNIVRASGQPGAGVNIMLRSPTAFEGSNSPLIVVDGVVIARDLDRTTADIESLDIESVEVIKGAAAASLYGSRAAAGVVSITTNRARNQARNVTRVTARTEIGKDYLAGTEKLTTAHHYIMNAAGNSLINSAGRDTTWAGRTARTVTANGGGARMMDQPYPGAIYDNLSALYKPDQYLNQSFSLSQNTENTTFLVNLTRTDQKGALEGNDGFWRQLRPHQH